LSEGVIEFVEELSTADIDHNSKGSVGIKALRSKLRQERWREVIDDIPAEIFKRMSNC
jgi:hypothetical protein